MPLAGPKLPFYNTKRGLTAISRATGERADLVSRLVWRCAWRPRFLEFYWEGSAFVPVSVLVSAPASVSVFFPSLSAKGLQLVRGGGRASAPQQERLLPDGQRAKEGVGFR